MAQDAGMLKLLIAIALALPGAALARTQGAGPLESTAVVLAYPGVEAGAQGASALSLEAFTDHAEYLKRAGVPVLGAREMAESLKNGQAVPAGAVTLTFDAPLVAMKKPVFEALAGQGVPFTLFIAPAQIGKAPLVLGWADVKDLAGRKGVTIGLTLTGVPDDLVTLKREFNAGLAAFRENMGFQPEVFAYPGGDYSRELKTLVAGAGFTAAFGLQSGAAYEGADFLALPRFGMAGDYGTIERFQSIIHTLPLPAADLEPAESLFTGDAPLIGFTVLPEYKGLLEHLSCFASGQGKVTPQILGDARVEIRLRESVSERLRVNCTAPAEPGNAKNTQKRWIGFLLSARVNNQEQPGLPPPPE